MIFWKSIKKITLKLGSFGSLLVRKIRYKFIQKQFACMDEFSCQLKNNNYKRIVNISFI